MKYVILSILLITIGGITFGNVMAATFNEVVFVNDEFKVIGGSATVQKSGGLPSAIVVQNSGSSSLIKLFDIDTLQEMHLRLIPNGQRMDFAIVGGSVPFAISMITGNVGIGGQLAPAEALDVIGNVKVSGDLKLAGSITSSDGSDICIGNC
ncbi:MAG: hypothetical protein OEL81_00065 [Nitrosopumilus sp.]|nr:hypothetical protein [Nitrosopumilus sp.]MDH3385538.1 hypothetical protein [Nitrosopumilus sp.]